MEEVSQRLDLELTSLMWGEHSKVVLVSDLTARSMRMNEMSLLERREVREKKWQKVEMMFSAILSITLGKRCSLTATRWNRQVSRI